MTNAIRGLKAKRQGQSFENIFESACLYNGIAVTRIPDSCRRVSHNKLLQVPSPFDFTISYRGRTAMIDTKTQAGKTYPYSDINSRQVLNLASHEAHGIPAGYVIWLREIDAVAFITAGYLEKAIGKRGSFQADSPYVKHLGPIATFTPAAIFS